MTLAASAPSTQAVRRARVGIIGTGFAGLGLAIRLRQSGDDDFIVLEKGDALGGTWRDNTYPGCACDVPSNLYSYSFAPNPDWTTTFAHQAEIRAYTERVAREHDLERSIHLSTEAQDARWDEDESVWRVATPRGEYVFSVLVSATGPLSAPSIPDIPGLASFEGPMFHSAQWDHDVDLAGKRVAVIGTGASAIQFVPQLQKVVGELKLFQRTPPWLLPRGEHRTSRLRRVLFRRFPVLQKVAREALFLGHESWVLGMARPKLFMPIPTLLAKGHIRRQIADPELRAKVTPSFMLGCKRILLSNDYYPALSKPNVEVLTTGVASVTPTSVVGVDGTEREVDAIVLGTGFKVSDFPIQEHVRGIGGVTLKEAWAGSMRGYRGATIPGFPNFFFSLGPNTGLGTSSMIYMAEAANQYVMDALAQMDRSGIASVDVRPERYDRWNAGVQRRMKPTVWVTGGCASWYLDSQGNNRTLWPSFPYRFRALTRRFDLESYTTLPAREPRPSVRDAAPASDAAPATA